MFFQYADQKASDALDNHLGVKSLPWTSELVSAWSRFIIAIHLRHPDAMPELRAAAAAIWTASGLDCQARYDAVRAPADPPTFDEYLALRDPLAPVKVRVNMIIKALDNEEVGTHINQMTHAVIDVSAAPFRLLTSDRPVELFNIKEPNGVLSLPLSPTKAFVAANDDATFDKLRRTSPEQLVCNINTFVVTRRPPVRVGAGRIAGTLHRRQDVNQHGADAAPAQHRQGEHLPQDTVIDGVNVDLPTKSLGLLADFIEYSEEDGVKILELTLAPIQIHNSRLRHLSAHSKYHLETHIVDAAVINAGASAYFEYAQGGKNMPVKLQWKDLYSALRNMDILEDTYPRIFEGLADRAARFPDA